MDTVSKEKRSEIMSHIHGKDTVPELKLRHYLFARGYRYRLHYKNLPGHPDLVFPKLRTAIFVHGCFWHNHPGCRYATVPKSNIDFWSEKFIRNRERDAKKVAELESLGWNVLIVWECELKGLNSEALEGIERALLARLCDVQVLPNRQP